MDPITVLSLLAQAAGISIDLVTAAKAYEEKSREKQQLQLRARWRSAQQRLDQHRLELTWFLHSYYASSPSTSEDMVGICYSIPDKHPRALPLITMPRYLLSTNPNFFLKGYYRGALPPSLPINEKDLVEQVSSWSALGMRIWDAPLYSFQKVSAEGDIDFRLTRFLAYRATFGVLPDELALAIAEHSIQQIAADPGFYLPWRTKLLPSMGALTNFAGRIVAGGPVVLFAVRLSEQEVGIVLQRRSFTVSDELGVFTVVPKAAHQPMIDPEFEVDPAKIVLRECYEELFGGEETGGYVDPEFFLRRCDAIRELSDPEVATLQPTGLVWDLSRGNYHLLYCYLVRKPEWWERHKSSIRLNWEVDPEIRPLVRLSDVGMVAHVLARENWAPESYVALVEGVRWLATGAEMGPRLPAVKSLLPSLNLERMGSLALCNTYRLQ